MAMAVRRERTIQQAVEGSPEHENLSRAGITAAFIAAAAFIIGTADVREVAIDPHGEQGYAGAPHRHAYEAVHRGARGEFAHGRADDNPARKQEDHTGSLGGFRKGIQGDSR